MGQEESYRHPGVNKRKYSRLNIIGVVKTCNISRDIWRVCSSDVLKYKRGFLALIKKKISVVVLKMHHLQNNYKLGSVMWQDGLKNAKIAFTIAVKHRLEKKLPYRHSASASKCLECLWSMMTRSWCFSKKHSRADSGVRAKLHLKLAFSHAQQKPLLWLSSLAKTRSTCRKRTTQDIFKPKPWRTVAVSVHKNATLSTHRWCLHARLRPFFFFFF